MSSFLVRALGSTVVSPFVFTSQSKSKLGFDLLAAVNSGRMKMYRPDGTEEYRQFWTEVERAKSFYRANQTVNFYVDPSDGDDDFLMSMALLAQSAGYRRRKASGRLRKGYE